MTPGQANIKNNSEGYLYMNNIIASKVINIYEQNFCWVMGQRLDFFYKTAKNNPH